MFVSLFVDMNPKNQKKANNKKRSKKIKHEQKNQNNEHRTSIIFCIFQRLSENNTTNN